MPGERPDSKKGKKGEKEPPPPEEEVPVVPDKGTGKFIYKADVTYEGEWERFPLVPVDADAEAAAEAEADGKKGGKTPKGGDKKKDAKKGGKGKEPVVEEVPKVFKRHGRGVMTDGDNVYDGEWVEDAMQGQGKMSYASGASYEGEWIDNVYEGVGKYCWPNGTYYMGEFVRGKMQGDGYFVDERGIKWKGKFYNNSGPGLLQGVQ